MQKKIKKQNGFTRTPKFGVTPKGGGFTLIEILFGMAIFVLIALVLTLFSRNVWVYNTFVSAGLTNADTGRQALREMVSEIRTASAADTGAYVINAATASSFTFYSNIDSDVKREKVRYFLNGTTLQKGIIKSTTVGTQVGYTGTEVITTLASNVINTSIFDYYNEDYDGTTAPLSFPVNVSDIRLIKITIMTDEDVNRPPDSMTFSTQISIRNLKDNL